MADVLSQSEVEALLAAFEQVKAPAGSDRGANKDPSDAPRVEAIDFRRPPALSEERLKILEARLREFARECTAMLQQLLRLQLDIQPVNVGQMTNADLFAALDEQSCFLTLQSSGLSCPVLVEVQPEVMFPMIDRLLGGGLDDQSQVSGRPFTTIELRLVERVGQAVACSLERAWSSTFELRLSLGSIESQARQVDFVEPSEAIIVSSSEMRFGSRRGLINVCLPTHAFVNALSKFNANSIAELRRRAADPHSQQALEDGLAKTAVEMVVELAETRLTAGEVAGLEIGDVIVTKQTAADGVKVYVEGRQIFSGSAGHLRGRKAVRVGQAVDIPADQPSDTDEIAQSVQDEP